MSEIDVNNCPCYINRPLHRYDKGCLIQSQAFSEQQTEEKPILRCDEIVNCSIKQAFEENKRLDSMLGKLNEELLKIVEPRMSDFTGYDEKTNSFDIVLAVKEIIEELEETIASKEVAIERLLNPEIEDEE